MESHRQGGQLADAARAAALCQRRPHLLRNHRCPPHAHQCRVFTERWARKASGTRKRTLGACAARRRAGRRPLKAVVLLHAAPCLDSLYPARPSSGLGVCRIFGQLIYYIPPAPPAAWLGGQGAGLARERPRDGGNCTAHFTTATPRHWRHALAAVVRLDGCCRCVLARA